MANGEAARGSNLWYTNTSVKENCCLPISNKEVGSKPKLAKLKLGHSLEKQVMIRKLLKKNHLTRCDYNSTLWNHINQSKSVYVVRNTLISMTADRTNLNCLVNSVWTVSSNRKTKKYFFQSSHFTNYWSNLRVPMPKGREDQVDVCISDRTGTLSLFADSDQWDTWSQRLLDNRCTYCVECSSFHRRWRAASCKGR